MYTQLFEKVIFIHACNNVQATSVYAAATYSSDAAVKAQASRKYPDLRFRSPCPQMRNAGPTHDESSICWM